MAPFRFRMPRYLFPISLLGTAAGGIVLLKDYMGGKRYTGTERMAGKTVIVTGANSGIGKETCLELARRGAKVIMACRNLESCEQAKAEIVLETANHSIHCRRLELASLASIRAFAKYINANESHLEVLINNAGIMGCPKSLTEDGFEMQLGVNHLGHFLLTNLLLDLLKKSAPSRIITVSSIAHKWGDIHFDDLNSVKHYDPRAAYEQSKLANVLFTIELAKRLEGTGVTANCLHPGIVNTDLSRHMSISKSVVSGGILSPLKWFIMKTPIQGAQTTLFLAIDPSVEKVSGKYFSDMHVKDIALQAKDEAAAKRLWAISEKWTRLSSRSQSGGDGQNGTGSVIQSNLSKPEPV
ncbi:retinol dehydrogenase 13-like [Gigantopelta aegis]|uniref:retinol dehydrogenase 13-like n=1 Tax=Gigantopelta aegis TaxID=1735272 RepID=UPI001B88AB03|nr:retinol dehydrogenase 13-like [Gigantopelta aegis]